MLAILTIAALMPAIADEACSLEGTVTNSVTNQPVAKATVELSAIGDRFAKSYSSTSDASGRFAMRGIAQGEYRLRVERTGFIEANHGPLVLAKSQAMKLGSVKLPPQGVIAGHVFDSDGEPISGADVRALRRGADGLQQSGLHSTTNDLGEYRLIGLRPGAYVVAATVSREGSRYAGDGAEDRFVPAYHPSVTSPGQATTVQLRSGATATGADITLRKSHTYTLQGHLAGAFGPDDFFTVVVKALGDPRDLPETIRLAEVHGKDATFELRDVVPGVYEIVGASSASSMVRELRGRAFVEVRDASIAGIVVSMGPRFEARGKVRFEGGMPTGSKIQVSFVPPGSYGDVQPDGRIDIPNLDAGVYRLQVYGLGGGSYVKSARVGQTDALREECRIDSNTDLDIVIASNGATLRGMVSDERSEPVAGATVVILPAHEGGQLCTATTDMQGRFSETGLGPGGYSVIAVENYDSGMERSLMESHAHSVEKVTLGEGAVETKSLKSVKPD